MDMENTINFLLGMDATQAYLFSALLLIVTAIKGFALWEAARREERWWFIALLFLNTLGILEIVYLFAFSQKEQKKEEKK